MFNKEKFMLVVALIAIGFGCGTWAGYPLGQSSMKTQLTTVTQLLSQCNSTTNNVDVGKVKNGASVVIAQRQKETFNPFISVCAADTVAIIGIYWKKPRSERRRLEKESKEIESNADK